MTGGREEEPYAPLVDAPVYRGGLHVKLDKGFDEGTYYVYVEFDGMSSRTSFAAARRAAQEYCPLLKGELDRLPGYSTGEIEDSTLTGDSGQNGDLGPNFLCFPIETSDGRYHDDAIKKQFRVAFARVGRVLDQAQAGEQADAKTHRRHARQERFRDQLDMLLHGDAYAGLDPALRERLLYEVPALAFPRRQIEP
jgi:hypothetical protein